MSGEDTPSKFANAVDLTLFLPIWAMAVLLFLGLSGMTIKVIVYLVYDVIIRLKPQLPVLPVSWMRRFSLFHPWAAVIPLLPLTAGMPEPTPPAPPRA
ncbi:hypothetical protein AURDEDRAFT_115204 [Auricularia subglabra TFB-10046 SS5]|nr:hypothetical protein AURDEDRAFT_115204 [Auricularia subglabra TFB-10046 SS5]